MRARIREFCGNGRMVKESSEKRKVYARDSGKKGEIELRERDK